jgi:hypothetical protein
LLVVWLCNVLSSDGDVSDCCVLGLIELCTVGFSVENEDSLCRVLSSDGNVSDCCVVGFSVENEDSLCNVLSSDCCVVGFSVENEDSLCRVLSSDGINSVVSGFGVEEKKPVIVELIRSNKVVSVSGC